MTWTASSPTPADGPLTGADRPLLEGYLGFQRTTLLNICAGLTAEQLAMAPVPATNLTLLGLVRHMIKVEQIWFTYRAHDLEVIPTYDAALGKDADFEDIHAEDAPDALQRLQEEWAISDESVRKLDFEKPVLAHGEPLALRFVYVHMIGEYARHNGHADLLRQSIDGVTGR